MAFQKPRRAAGRAKYAICAVLVLCTLFYTRNSTAATFNTAFRPIGEHLSDGASSQSPIKSGGKGGAHPIATLIDEADKTFEDLLRKESHSLNSAAAAYRTRRGRHPPPGFDAWYAFAQENGAVMVEEFFDQIYHDLGPFWGVEPKVMRREAWDYEMTINVRNQNASAGSDWFWTQIWLDLTKTIQHLLPDMDLALNSMDEPRIVVPWEDINGYMEKERASRHMAPPEEVVSDFQVLNQHPDTEVEIAQKWWESKKETRMYIMSRLKWFY